MLNRNVNSHCAELISRNSMLLSEYLRNETLKFDEKTSQTERKSTPKFWCHSNQNLKGHKVEKNLFYDFSLCIFKYSIKILVNSKLKQLMTVADV